MNSKLLNKQNKKPLNKLKVQFIVKLNKQLLENPSLSVDLSTINKQNQRGSNMPSPA